MSIPQLTTCCFGCCSLKNGSKAIGWIAMIISVLMLVITSFGLASLYYIEGHPNENPNAKDILPHITAMKAITTFLIAVHVIGCGLAFVLLMGIYQSKAKYVLIWVQISLACAIVEQLVNIMEQIVFHESNQMGTFFFVFVAFFFDLYFILVVYSFYREIINVSNYA